MVVRVFLIEPRALVRAGLASMLRSPRIVIVGAASSLLEAIDFLGRASVDVVIFDPEVRSVHDAESRLRPIAPGVVFLELAKAATGQRLISAVLAGASRRARRLTSRSPDRSVSGRCRRRTT